MADGDPGAGWYGLLAIYRTSAETRRVWRERQPQACPNDGEPLRGGPDGQLYCPFDGWRWDGQAEPDHPWGG